VEAQVDGQQLAEPELLRFSSCCSQQEQTTTNQIDNA
jgi:hypothetical protein